MDNPFRRGNGYDAAKIFTQRRIDEVGRQGSISGDKADREAEDAKVNEERKRVKEEERKYDRLPDETDEQFSVRMAKLQYKEIVKGMTVTEKMNYDASLMKQNRDARLRREPYARGEITQVKVAGDGKTVYLVEITFDVTHPDIPDRSGFRQMNKHQVCQYSGAVEGQQYSSCGRPETGMKGDLIRVPDPYGPAWLWLFIVDAA